MGEFSQIQMALFGFFELKVRASALFKIREKVEKKIQEFEQANHQDKSNKEQQLQVLLLEQQQLRQAALKSVIPNWLSASAEEAVAVGKPMLKVTHPAKFAHGDVPYNGIFVKPIQASCNFLITTDTLRTGYFDLAMSNGNLITHARFLLTDIDGKTIYEALEQNDDAWLFEISDDDEQIYKWAEGLKHWLGSGVTIETSRLKQIYFFDPKNDTYSLVSPLFSSSLAQALYEKIRDARFDKQNIQRRKARRNDKYAEGELLSLPNIATINFGGTQPQNISVGNFERHGETYLLPCVAPHWKTELKPPINNVSIYHGEFNQRARFIAKELRIYLIKLHGEKSNKRTRQHVINLVNQIIDVLLDYVSQIQSMDINAGWSRDAENLKLEHKLWLDRQNTDTKFQELRRAGNWQSVVCKDFGLWLNQKLEHKKAVFESIESHHWGKLLRKQLNAVERQQGAGK